MSQLETVGLLEQAVGYVLKQAAAALRTAMDVVLRPLALTVPHYACLEVLGQQPGLNSELARSVFVTRQSMNGVLRGLQDRGLVTRAVTAPHGRALPTHPCRAVPATRRRTRRRTANADLARHRLPAPALPPWWYCLTVCLSRTT